MRVKIRTILDYILENGLNRKETLLRCVQSQSFAAKRLMEGPDWVGMGEALLILTGLSRWRSNSGKSDWRYPIKEEGLNLFDGHREFPSNKIILKKLKEFNRKDGDFKK